MTDAAHSKFVSDRWRVFALLAIALLGVIARVELSNHSLGSVDAIYWTEFAQHAHDRGLIDLYRTDPRFNHPPLAGLAAGAIDALARRTGASFLILFRAPMIAADVISCALLFFAIRKRIGARAALLAVAVFAWNVNAIFICAHHVNTDSLMAMLMLLSAFLLEAWSAPLSAGLALAAAINVKLIPVFLIFPMLAACRSREAMSRFAIGLSFGAIPFLAVMCFAPLDFANHVFRYGSFESDWGLPLLLHSTLSLPQFSMAAINPKIYFSIGKWIVLLAIVALTFDVRRRTLDAYTAAASAAAIFLIFTPGFTITYSALVTPLLLVASMRHGTTYVLLASVMTLCFYARGWDFAFPINTRDVTQFVAPASLYGLLAWGTLVAFVWTALRAK